MKILICDDNLRDVQPIKDIVEDYMKCKFIDYEIDVEADPQIIMSNSTIYQLAFLDICMNNVDGLTLAKELIKRNGRVVVFFVTMFVGYQDDAMDLRAFRFFEKPIDPVRLRAGLDKALEFIGNNYIDIYVGNGRNYQKILVDEVMYIEKTDRKVRIITADGSYLTNETFEHWEDVFQSKSFYRIHKSIIVNTNCIAEYQYNELTLNNGIILPIASRRQAKFRRFWFNNVYNKK